MRDLPPGSPTAAPNGQPTVVEEYWERRVETPDGQLIERQVRHIRWGAAGPAPTTRDMVEAAAPVLRALAIAIAPAVGRLAVRALAPRLLAALPLPTPTLRIARRRRQLGRARPVSTTPPALALPAPSGSLPALPPARDDSSASR